MMNRPNTQPRAPRGALAGALALAGILSASAVRAGPPYVTDDPEPVEHRHWEVYLATLPVHERDGWTSTAPHIEVNYGALPGLQLHLIAPLTYSAPAHGGGAFGYGDTELGAKFRFLDEGKWTPMIGTFPLVEVPTGAQARGLGNGTAQVFVPFWLQKSFGEWTTYGGWGVWLDAGNADRHWWFFGWLVQRRFFDRWTVGAEIYHTTPEEHGADGDTRFNVGTTFDITEDHHLLLSAGRSIAGDCLFQGYFAYQLTFGP
jgi:hypothetical protein